MPLAPDPAHPILPLLRRGARDDAGWRLILWLAWLGVAGWLAWHHVFWRDEVRAFTLATWGDDVGAMFWRLHGEGHPALWYLLLRAARAVIGARMALPLTAFAIGAGATALFAWRAPFRPLVIGLVLFSAFALYEYTVSARNYGVAMLLMFVFAAHYRRGRERGVGLGVLLACLCNTNVPAVLLAGGLGLFWGVELLLDRGGDPAGRWRHYALNMALALAGVIACIATVYPPYNDAAAHLSRHSGLVGSLAAALGMATPFAALVPAAWANVPFASVLLAAMVTGSIVGLIRSPAGLAAGAAVGLTLPLFFQLVYPGSYRHQALFVVFMLTLYWLVAEGGGGRWPARAPVLRPALQRALQRLGQGGLVALLLVQVTQAVLPIGATAMGVPSSRSRDLGLLLRREPLDRAVVIAFPDVLLEPLGYYAPNPVWLVRERRWGRVAAFTTAAERDVSLSEMLATARRLRAATGRPVVVVLKPRLDPRAPAQAWPEHYVGALTTTPGEVRAFLAATRRLARFGPVMTDETYDVYLLR